MSLPIEKQLEDMLEDILSEYKNAKARSNYTDYSDVIDRVQCTQFQTRCIAAVELAVGKSSSYYRQVIKVNESGDHIWNQLQEQIGVVEALLHDIRKGYLRSVEENIHGELFGDFLEMADHLVSNGYKDAAAVIAGSTLESHLRQLCKKTSVVIEKDGKPKKADQLNAELVTAGAYTKLDQKNVTAWLDLRNNAAHGNYANYQKEQVALLIGNIRDFITRNPA